MNGTLVNYYFHCKRQCYLFGNRLNLEDNSETVKIGRAIHESKNAGREDSELAIENIRIDRLSKEYLIEMKKSDADVEASKWQLLYYLKVLRDKGIERKGKLEFVEKNKGSKVIYLELTEGSLGELETHIAEIRRLLDSDNVPAALNKGSCKKCAYYEYCCI
jgi:CRISPR-associated exonuclease Cas4